MHIVHASQEILKNKYEFDSYLDWNKILKKKSAN